MERQTPLWNDRGPYDSLEDPQLGSSTSFRQKRTLCAHTGKVGFLSPSLPRTISRVLLVSLHLPCPRALPAGVAGLSARATPRSSRSCSSQS